MSRRQPDLMIDGLRLPLPIAGEIEQSYEFFGGYTMLRLGAGAAVHQEAWRRIRTTLSASGIAPPGLDGIDWSQPHTLGCVAARSIQSASNVITIPAARRTDAPPYGWAITAAGLLIPAAIAVVGNIATLGAVGGAIGYHVAWYPLLTVRVPAGLSVRFDAHGALASWELACEEA